MKIIKILSRLCLSTFMMPFLLIAYSLFLVIAIINLGVAFYEWTVDCNNEEAIHNAKDCLINPFVELYNYIIKGELP